MKPRDLHNRRSIRLPEYDYSQAGAYFITICTHNRTCLFGEIIDGGMQLDQAGKMISQWWLELANKFPHVQIDESIIMPNHVHGIILITEPPSIPVGAARCGRPGRPHRGAPTIGDIIRWFKTMTTNEYIRKVKKNGWQPYRDRFWQRNYYEHIIRNENDLRDTREYIFNNPQQWHIDRDNPDYLPMQSHP